MKILIVCDEECPAYWDYYQPGRLKEFDLILSCGDLKPDYLTFLVTMARCPVLYVHGNHDSIYRSRPPEGCDCIDGNIVTYNGLRIAGLGGCKKYHPGRHQYTERQMRRRIRKLRFPLWRTKGVDILVTHAPPEDLGDAPDPAHRGFDALRLFLDKYRPRYLLHGHVHLRYGGERPRELEYQDTRIINCTERYVLEIPDMPCDPRQRGQVIYRSRIKLPEDED